jgi:hypothetical protein
MRLLRRDLNASRSIRYLWRDPNATEGAATAVSLHSHTMRSREGLDFIPRVLRKVAPAQVVLGVLEDRHRRRWGKEVQYDRLFWRPPLNPRAAYELEARQIRERLNLNPLVSITDHDDIAAPRELRALNIHVPFSHEWTVPFENTVFHLGIHNLPAEDARPLFDAMARVTADPTPQRLRPVLRDLDALGRVLVVLNHPLSNEVKTGYRAHVRLLRRFLREYGCYFHALELNGLQPHSHNRRVARMAAEMHLPVISGGDRHCLEPSANVNLTNAATFTEFVAEIRRERVSRVLFLPQYRETIPCRYIEFISQAVATYPEFIGRERWVNRIFRQLEDGEEAISVHWPHGGPWLLRAIVWAIGFVASPQMRGTLRLALGAQGEAGA